MNAPGTDVAEVELVELIPSSLEDRATEVEQAVARAKEQAEAVEVTNEAEAVAAVELSKAFNREHKALDKEGVALTKPRMDAAKEIKRIYDGARAPYLEADKIVREKLKTYNAKREQEARERQRKIDEERERVEAEARAKREAAEKAEREAAELREEVNDAGDAAAAEELAAEARREAEKAQVVEQAIQSSSPTQAVAAPKLSGFSETRRWAIKSIDPTQLPAEYLIPDEKAINEAMREGVRENKHPPEIPGVVFEQITGTAVRS